MHLGKRSYPILIGYKYINQLGSGIKKYLKNKKIMIITDNNVNKLYGKKVTECLKSNGYSVYLTAMPNGEKYKNIEQTKRIYKECIKHNLHRDSCIIALGGGVVSDLAGFVAATYMRGLPLINIPTTLIGQVDAAIGGKTAINFQAKNIIGSFYQPKIVIIDTVFLQTLPQKEIRNGLAEIIKYAVIKDAKLFEFLERNEKEIIKLNKNCLIKIISECCKIKTEIVEKDERENNLRKILNFGHTIGHAIETTSNYKIDHGEAIAIGIAVETKIARLLNLLDEKQEKTIKDLIKKYNPLIKINLKKEKILEAIQFDKKNVNDEINFALPIKIGKISFVNVPINIITKALD